VSAVWWVFLGLAMGAPIGIFVANLLVAWSRQEIEEAAYRRGEKDTMDRVCREAIEALGKAEMALRRYGP